MNLLGLFTDFYCYFLELNPTNMTGAFDPLAMDEFAICLGSSN